jgi:uroporphyrinogen-III synthase
MFMVTNLPLAGMKVLVTRPEHQAHHLSRLISEQGGMAISFPVIEIKPIAVESWTDLSIEHADMIIFVSRNAVDHFMAGKSELLTATSILIAVGKGTAEAMNKHGLSVDFQPRQSTGAEGLLLLPELEQVEGKQITIVRGKGGRELLADTLIARGAMINYIEVYERCLPLVSNEQCKAAFQADKIICTSLAGVENLMQLLKDNLEIILVKPLIVVSERIKQQALSFGFKHVVVSVDASDQSILQRLMEMER